MKLMMIIVLAERFIKYTAHQDVSIPPRSSIYFEDLPRRSIEYFRIHQETLRRGGQEIIQNMKLMMPFVLAKRSIKYSCYDVSIPPRSSIYFEDLPRREYFDQETPRRGGQEIIKNI